LEGKISPATKSSALRFFLLLLAALFSLPATFTIAPDMGLDPSWKLSLQLATLQSKIFGHDFVFTYGPLGWLMVRTELSRAGLLLYDLFILFGLVSIYRALLPDRPKWIDAVLLIVLALVTRACLQEGSVAVLFTILCHWLWRIYERGGLFPVVTSVVAATLLFFGKANYGLIMAVLIPAFAIGLAVLQPDRRRRGLLLLLGFIFAVWFGAWTWNVNLPEYLGSSLQIISGYNEAMMNEGLRNSLMGELNSPLQSVFDYELAVPFLLALAVLFFLGRRRLPLRDQLFLLPLVAFAAFLLFKNAFVRSDGMHNLLFYRGLPLLLAFFCIAWRGAVPVKIFLLLSLLYPVALAGMDNNFFQPAGLASAFPANYFQQALAAPANESVEDLQRTLAAKYPETALPAAIRARIGASTVDVMPSESSLAVRNGLNYCQRPVPQAYSAYTTALDAMNAEFLRSTNAPDWILYTGAMPQSVDDRLAAWDESITKRALLENYALETEFELSQHYGSGTKVMRYPIFLLKHRPGWRRLVAVATNEVALQFDQPLAIPAGTNLAFLTLEIKRSLAGKLQAALLRPHPPEALLTTPEGTRANRAITGLLATGVLVNRRVESSSEIRRWLSGAADQNPAISSICFSNTAAWAFQPSFAGALVEYRLEEVASTNAPAVK
jgi:hypothetical protein